MPSDDADRATMDRYVEAWKAGNLEAMLAAYDDDVVFHYFGSTDLAGDHVGKEAAVTAMINASSRSTRELLEVVDVLVGDQRTTLVARERFTRDGESADVERVLVYRIESGKFAECWLYDQDQARIDRFWAP